MKKNKFFQDLSDMISNPSNQGKFHIIDILVERGFTVLLDIDYGVVSLNKENRNVFWGVSPQKHAILIKTGDGETDSIMIYYEDDVGKISLPNNPMAYKELVEKIRREESGSGGQGGRHG